MRESSCASQPRRSVFRPEAPFVAGAPSLTTSAAELQSVLARFKSDPPALVQILRECQAMQGWLPRDSVRLMAEALGLSLAHVEGVAGFYRFFHTQPVGVYRVLCSDNVTDRLLGAEALMADLCRRLGVAPGRLGGDALVSVDKTSCTGLCDQGPALLINHHQVVTRLDSARVAQMPARRVPLSAGVAARRAAAPARCAPAGWQHPRA